MLKYRIPILPATVSEGRITFPTITLSLSETMSLEGENSTLYFENSEPVNIYLDPSYEPKFSRHPSGGWCSPPYSKLEEAEAAGIELDCFHVVNCKCHKKDPSMWGDSLSADDLESLEECGHTADCKQVTQKLKYKNVMLEVASNRPASFFSAQSLSAAQPPNPVSNSPVNSSNPPIRDPSEPDPSDPNAPQPKPKIKPAPPGGLTDDKLNQLVSQLMGTDLPIDAGLQTIKSTDSDIRVVSKQLLADYSFTLCKSCGTWNTVMSIGNPKCAGCSIGGIMQ